MSQPPPLPFLWALFSICTVRTRRLLRPMGPVSPALQSVLPARASHGSRDSIPLFLGAAHPKPACSAKGFPIEIVAHWRSYNLTKDPITEVSIRRGHDKQKWQKLASGFTHGSFKGRPGGLHLASVPSPGKGRGAVP